MTQGTNINPLDGRYYDKTRALAPYFSELALMKYRVMVECKYLIALSLSRKVGLRKFNPKEIKLLENLLKSVYISIMGGKETTKSHFTRSV